MSYNPSGGGGAPTGASYITQTADAGLSGEQALSTLATGVVKVTNGTGVLSTAVAGTDYAAASHTHAAADIASGTVATARLGSGTANSTTFLRGDQAWAAPTASVSDGDKGDITVSGGGATWEIDAGVVTTTELGGDITTAGKALLDDANAAAQRTTLGLGTAATAATGDFEPAGAIATHAAVTSGVHGISAFGATLVDDADAGTARTTLGLGTLATQSGTFSGTSSGTNSGDVALAGTPDYITIAGQTITRGLVDLATDVTGDLPYANLTPATAASRLLGRGSASGAGDWQEVTLGSNLSMSGTVLSAAGGGGAWTTVKQTADDSKTNNTLTASTFLTVALSAATHYTIRGVAFLLVQDAAADARFDINYSGTWTTVYCVDKRNVAGVAAGTDNQTVRIASALPGSTDMLATVTGMCVVEFTINGLTNASGTLSFRFAQVTTTATATLLKRGSYLEHMSA